MSSSPEMSGAGLVAAGRSTELSGSVLSGMLAVLLLIAAVLGPLVTGRIRFHLSADAVVQYVGGEIVTCVIAAALLVSVAGWWTGRVWAPSLTAGAAAYVAYTIITVVAGQEYGRYPGNVEKAFMLYAAMTATSALLFVVSFRALLSAGHLAGPRHLSGAVLIGVGVVVALLWLAQLAGFYKTGPTAEYETATALFWLIKFLDLGLVLPMAALTGLYLLVTSTGAEAAAVTMLGFTTWLLAAVLFMALEMLRRSTPGASWALAIGVLVLLTPCAVAWARWLVRSG